ncbi:hypothetical protein KUTeg_023459 [Tegillarca granosa]|uniref:Uncharacterized protein n=1 Tax=Tegillarca granosa TaxID=220873 RepID=A0ABQ9E558_TEGGR|nr:hypothetical protein KUTeg_023459 [Tegillarca granosa]
MFIEILNTYKIISGTFSYGIFEQPKKNPQTNTNTREKKQVMLVLPVLLYNNQVRVETQYYLPV